MTDDKQNGVTGVAAAQRALSILTCFRQGDDYISLAEIARRTGLVKSTILRLLASLEEAGLVLRIDNHYRLGSEILRLHSIYSASHSMDKIVMPMLADLAERTQETAAFYIAKDEQRFCLFRVNSPLALRMDIAPGSYRPMDHASSAQILKLFAGWPDDRPAVPAMPIYTAGATNPHTASLSAPVLGAGLKLSGALSITGPVSRLTWDAAKRFEEAVMATAAQMSRALGGNLDQFWGLEPPEGI